MSEFLSQTKIERLHFLSVILILLPPFFLLTPVFSSHYLAGGIWLFIVLLIGWRLYKGNKVEVNNKFLLILFILFFLSQSVSIVNAVNIGSFLATYKNTVFSSVLFILSLIFVRKKYHIEKLIIIFYLAASINIGLQTLVLLFPSITLSLIQQFIHGNYIKIIELNLFRGRIFIESYDEILIPVIFYSIINGRNKKIFLSMLFILIVIFIFLSGFRTKIFTTIAGAVGMSFIYVRYLKKYFILFFSITAVIYILYQMLFFMGKPTVIDRFLDFESNIGQITSGRIERWEKGIEIGLHSPFLGVGLGNYYDYLDRSMQRSASVLRYRKEEFELAALDPHNIFVKVFAETGFFGLISLLGLLIYFLKSDFLALRMKENYLSKSLVISFWMLVLFSFFNPSTSIVFQSMFWLLRAMIERSSSTTVA